MENKNQSNGHLALGIVILLALIAAVGLTGYFVSRPKPMTIQGEVEAVEYKVSGKGPGRV